MATVTAVSGYPVFMRELVEHFRAHELIDLGEEGKAYSTRHRCNSVLNKWILPRWQDIRISNVRTIDVENWLRSLRLARGTKAKIRKTFNLLFNHAIRWEFAVRNPISGPVRGSGVRQSEKRERIPDVLTAEEFRTLEAALPSRERVLICLALSLGLRRGELAALRLARYRFRAIDDHSPTLISRSGCRPDNHRCISTAAADRPTNCNVAATLALDFKIYGFTGLRVCDRCESRRGKTWQTASVVGESYAVPRSAHCTCGGHHEDNRMAHAAPQPRNVAASKWRGDKGRAGTAKTYVLSNYARYLRTGRDLRKTESAEQGSQRVYARIVQRLASWHEI